MAEMENSIEMTNVGNPAIEDIEREMINIVNSLEGTSNLQFATKYLTDLLIKSNTEGRTRGIHNLPIEFKLIKYLSTSPTLLTDYLNGFARFKEEDIRLTNQTVNTILSAATDQIAKGVFREIGSQEDCYNALVFYVKERQKESTHSFLPTALSELQMLHNINDTVSFNKSWHAILNEIKTNYPALFSSQQENESLLVKSERMLRAAKGFIKAGIYNNIDNESVCMLLILDYIKLTENVNVPSKVFPKLYKELQLLASLNRDIELETVLRKIILDVKSDKQSMSPETTQKEQNFQEEKRNQIANIVTNEVNMEIHQDIDDRYGCIFSIITLLLVTENHESANEKIGDQSTVHKNILLLNQAGKEEELNMYIRKLLVIAKTPFSLKGLNAASLQRGFDLSKSKIVENVLSLVATLAIAWLCTLHVLSPEPSAFESGYDNEDVQDVIYYQHPLLNPSLSSWLVISVVCIVVLVGFLIWDLFCVFSLRKSFPGATKDLANIILPIAIANITTFPIAYAFVLISPPFWITLSIFCILAVGVHLIARLVISQVVRLIHYKVVGHIEIQSAYNTLNVSSTGVYAEVCKAYAILEKVSCYSTKDNLPASNQSITKIKRPHCNKLRQAVVVIARETLRNPNQTRFLKCLRSFW